MPRPPLPSPAPTAAHADPVLLAHAGVLVCNKPAGLAATGRDLSDPACLQGLLMARRQRAKIWAVHQLDQDTSGLILFVERKALVQEVGGWLQSGDKRYLALVHGRLGPGSIRVSAPIGERTQGGRRFPALAAEGRPASSVVRALSVGPAHSLVEVRIETGRTHQVRLHLLSLGHPLVGERLHRQPPCTLHPRQALHAWRLRLPQAPGPLSALQAPIPDDLVSLADRLGLTLPDARA